MRSNSAQEPMLGKRIGEEEEEDVEEGSNDGEWEDSFSDDPSLKAAVNDEDESEDFSLFDWQEEEFA